MAMNFSRAGYGTGTPMQGQELEVQEYDILADRDAVKEQLAKTSEIDDLTSLIEVDNLESIVTFGAQTAEEISKASDVVLNGMNLAQLDESSAMLKTLTKIMSQFDIDEIRDDPGVFGKIFGNARKKLDKILAKYHTMGEDVDKMREAAALAKELAPDLMVDGEIQFDAAIDTAVGKRVLIVESLKSGSLGAGSEDGIEP